MLYVSLPNFAAGVRGGAFGIGAGGSDSGGK